MTNTGSIRAQLAELSEDAREAVFRINGKVVDQDFEITTGGRQEFDLPKLTHAGRNYIEVDLVFEDERIKTLYASIDYTTPTLVLNGGVSSTMTREIEAEILDVTPDATDMRMKLNGGEFVPLGTFQQNFRLTLPNWKGPNYVNIELDYEDGSTASFFAKIVLE